MTLTPSVRAISLCSFPCVARSFACASFDAISTLECFFFLAIAACIRPSPCCCNFLFRVRWYQANARRALARFTGLRINMVNMGVGSYVGVQVWNVRDNLCVADRAHCRRNPRGGSRGGNYPKNWMLAVANVRGALVPNISRSMGTDCGRYEGVTARKRPR